MSERYFILAPGVEKSDPFLLVFARHIGGRLHEIDLALHGTGLDILAYVPDAHGRAGDAAAHVFADLGTRKFFPSRNGIAVIMVHIALRAVEHKALYAPADSVFKSAAHERRPVGRNLGAADGVGMGAEVDDGDIGSSRTLDAQKLQRFIRLSKGSNDILVAVTGIGAHGTVLHAEAADKGNAAAIRRAERERSGGEIGARGPGRRDDAGDDLIGIGFNLRRFFGSVTLADLRLAAGVGVGAVDELARTGNAQFLFDDRIRLATQFFTDVDIVHRENEPGLAVPRKRYALCRERIQNPVHKPLVEISRKRNPVRRRYVHAGESRFEIAVGQRGERRQNRKRHHFQLIHY